MYEKKKRKVTWEISPIFLNNWKKLTLNEIRKCVGRSSLEELDIKSST